MFKKIIILVLGLGLMLLSLAYRTGGMSPSDFIDASPNRLPTQYQVAHPETLLNQAELALQAKNIELANQLTLQALRKNITNGLSFAQLLSNDLAAGKPPAELETLASLAEQLWPAHMGIRLKLSDYWQRRGDLLKTLDTWHVLMLRSPELGQDIYPALFQLLNYPEGLSALKPYSEYPPNWWLGFFNYTAQQKSLPALNALYQLRETSTTALSPEERATYINSLISNNLWEQAYFIWLAGLNDNQLKESGFIYNGSFEANEKTAGFDWQFSQTPLVKIKLASTNGMTGQKALYLSLLDEELINFQHIQQVIKLNPGFYDFSFRYRIDRLQTNEGLRWRLRCLNEKMNLLSESKPLITRSSWTRAEFTFEVPDQACAFQMLRLEASSPYAHNHSFKGSLWFDALQITRSKQHLND